MIVRHEPEGGVLSNAVEANGFVFLAGSVADDLSLDIEGQTRQALDYIDTMLARCGTSKSRIVSATVWITDTANMAGYNKVWKAWID
ncbi:MAG: Rid family hydrolase, partial [Hyphomicrobiaceae bacterium]